MESLEVYFCPACTSIQPDALELSTFPVSAIVALDQLGGFLLLFVFKLIREASGSSVCSDRRTGSDLRHGGRCCNEA